MVANQLAGVFGHCVALEAVTGQSKFVDGADNPLVGRVAPLLAGNSTELRDHPPNAIIVNTKTFAAFVGEHAINSTCVKVDVEGAEFRFLDGIGDAGNKIGTLVADVLGSALSDGFFNKASSVLDMHAYYILGAAPLSTARTESSTKCRVSRTGCFAARPLRHFVADSLDNLSIA